MATKIVSGLGVLGLAVLLVGCTGASAQRPGGSGIADCGASTLQGAAGQPVTGTSASDVTVGGLPVQSKGLVRIYTSGQAVTMDYRAERLNLEIDTDGKLVQATCG
ncbi:I78 family peptidase inhibitor [Devosia sp. 2618]|uniref:I78 family peptidase inhibitor n=1 Tax=Devosia sp. 2618 TaxID=3156454 RepID=UPI0033973B6A